jgi:hypothetical protein
MNLDWYCWQNRNEVHVVIVALYWPATNGNFKKPTAFSNITNARRVWDTITGEIAVASLP